MTNSFSISANLNVEPGVLYNAWLDSKEHTKVTGSEASIDPEIGGRFTAWEGYISGITLEKEENRRIVQRWRTTEFPDGSPDSIIELLFEKTSAGTKLTINHSDIPEGQADEYLEGWEEYYFKPMQEYYSQE